MFQLDFHQNSSIEIHFQVWLLENKSPPPEKNGFGGKWGQIGDGGFPPRDTQWATVSDCEVGLQTPILPEGTGLEGVCNSICRFCHFYVSFKSSDGEQCGFQTSVLPAWTDIFAHKFLELWKLGSPIVKSEQHGHLMIGGIRILFAYLRNILTKWTFTRPPGLYLAEGHQIGLIWYIWFVESFLDLQLSMKVQLTKWTVDQGSRGAVCGRSYTSVSWEFCFPFCGTVALAARLHWPLRNRSAIQDLFETLLMWLWLMMIPTQY